MFSESSAGKIWSPTSFHKLVDESPFGDCERITPLPGGQWIVTQDLYNSDLVLQNTLADSMAIKNSWKIETQGVTYSYSYHTLDNGKTVLLAILSSVSDHQTVTRCGYVLVSSNDH